MIPTSVPDSKTCDQLGSSIFSIPDGQAGRVERDHCEAFLEREAVDCPGDAADDERERPVAAALWAAMGSRGREVMGDRGRDRAANGIGGPVGGGEVGAPGDGDHE